MGGSKTSSSTKTTIPKEIRERGTKITNAAMGEYFNPADKYQSYGSSYADTGAQTTGQLNGYHQQAGNQIGQAGNQYNQASQSYQPYYNAATSTLGGVQGSTANQYTGPTGGASGYNGPTGGAQGWTGNAQTGTQLNADGNVNQGFQGPWNTAQNVNGPNFSDSALSQFMNPYTSNVIDQGVRRIQDEMTQGRLANQSRAASAGAFGGTRHAILDAENQNNAMTNLSDFVGSQMANNYNQATNQFNTNFSQGLQANAQNNAAAGQNFNQGLSWQNQNNQANQSNLQNLMSLNSQNNATAGQNFNQQLAALGLNNQATGQNFNQGLAGQQLTNQALGQNFNQGLAALQANNQAAGQNYNQGLSSANFLQGLGTANMQAGINSGDAMLRGSKASSDLGNIYTAQDQAQKDNAYEKGYLDQRNYPMEVYERLAAMNAMQPVNRTSTGTQSQSGGWLGPALGAVGSIMGSDERIKEDVHERDPEQVLGAFAEVRPVEYTYKASAREAHPDITFEGRRRGFMAQDLERAFGRPSGPTLRDGTKTVDIPNLLGDVVAAITGLEKRTRALKPVTKRRH